MALVPLRISPYRALSVKEPHQGLGFRVVQGSFHKRGLECELFLHESSILLGSSGKSPASSLQPILLQEQQTQLHLVAEEGQSEALKKLIEAGADVTARTKVHTQHSMCVTLCMYV